MSEEKEKPTCRFCKQPIDINGNCYDCYCKEREEAFKEGVESYPRKLEDIKKALETEYKRQLDQQYKKGYQDGLKARPSGPYVRCVECASENVVSKGSMWLCRDCGRWFSKIYRKKRMTIDLKHSGI